MAAVFFTFIELLFQYYNVLFVFPDIYFAYSILETSTVL